MFARQRRISKQTNRLLRRLEHATKETRERFRAYPHIKLDLRLRWDGPSLQLIAVVGARGCRAARVGFVCIIGELRTALAHVATEKRRRSHQGTAFSRISFLIAFVLIRGRMCSPHRRAWLREYTGFAPRRFQGEVLVLPLLRAVRYRW